MERNEDSKINYPDQVLVKASVSHWETVALDDGSFKRLHLVMRDGHQTDLTVPEEDVADGVVSLDDLLSLVDRLEDYTVVSDGYGWSETVASINPDKLREALKDMFA